MRNLLGTCSLLLLAASSKLAQSTASASASAMQALNAAVAQASPVSTGCPAGFEASRLPAQTLQQASRPESFISQPGRASLDLSLPSQHGMVSAKVLLFGLTGPTVLPADAQPAGAPHGKDAEELFVTFHSPERQRVHAVARSLRLTGVQWVELQEVDFGDGHKWHETSQGACRITPNGFRLVTSNTR